MIVHTHRYQSTLLYVADICTLTASDVFVLLYSVVQEQETQEQPRGEMDERGLDLRLTTFNLLAPCYKRMHSLEAPLAAGIANAGTGLLARRAKTERTARESEFAGLWRERAMETVRETGGGAHLLLALVI